MKVEFEVIGWRDPAYFASSPEGYGEYKKPRIIVGEFTADEVFNISKGGNIVIAENKELFVDFDCDASLTIKKIDCIELAVFHNCILLIS